MGLLSGVVSKRSAFMAALPLVAIILLLASRTCVEPSIAAPTAEPVGASPMTRVANVDECPYTRPPAHALKRTGKRALVLYSLTHREAGSVHAVEMENFNFFMQHALFPEGYQTALFTQVDYVFQRVILSNDTRQTTECRSKNTQGNIRIFRQPAAPCDLCSASRILAHLNVTEHSSKYAFVVVVNSGTRGPFFSMAAPVDGQPPFTWIDYLALGAEAQFSGTVITANSGSLLLQPHFQTYGFGLPIRALKVFRPLFDTACRKSQKLDCIFQVEIKTAETAFRSTDPRLRLRTLMHSPDRSFDSVDSFRDFVGAAGIGESFALDHPKACQMLFAKFGGDMWDRSLFKRDYVHTITAQTFAQVTAAKRIPATPNTVDIFRKSYFTC